MSRWVERRLNLIARKKKLLAKPRVVITGIGTVLPGALTVDDFWKNISEGQSQIDFITRFPTDDLSVKVAAELKGFDPKINLPPRLDPKFVDKYSYETLILMNTLGKCLADSRLDYEEWDPERVQLFDSSSRSSMYWWDEAYRIHYTEPEMDSKFNRHAILTGMASNPATLSALAYNVQGFVTCISGGCVGGHHAVSLSAQAIRNGEADIAFACGHDFPILKPLIRTYSDPKARALSIESENPKEAMKPYDRRRDGFTLGEGCIAICLEKLEHAQARNAKIYAEVLSFYNYNEADHPLHMDLSGRRLSEGMEKVLEMGDVTAADISYFCGHGTSTHYNDLSESRAMRQYYKIQKTTKWAPLGSLKPIYGHIFGASGIVNVAGSALMIHNQTLCPTINHKTPDPECDHDHVAEGKRPGKVNLALSLAYAIGSQTSLVCLAKI